MPLAQTLSEGNYLQVGVVQISLTNLLIILLMILVFVLALVLPFPHSHDDAPGAHDVRR